MNLLSYSHCRHVNIIITLNLFELWCSYNDIHLTWGRLLLKFNIYVRCDMASIVPMHRNKPNYLLTCLRPRIRLKLKYVNATSPFVYSISYTQALTSLNIFHGRWHGADFISNCLWLIWRSDDLFQKKKFHHVSCIVIDTAANFYYFFSIFVCHLTTSMWYLYTWWRLIASHTVVYKKLRLT